MMVWPVHFKEKNEEWELDNAVNGTLAEIFQGWSVSINHSVFNQRELICFLSRMNFHNNEASPVLLIKSPHPRRRPRLFFTDQSVEKQPFKHMAYFGGENSLCRVKSQF